MNAKFTFIFLFITAFLLSCEKDENIDNHENELVDSLKNEEPYLIVGQIDSIDYFDFDPDIQIGFIKTSIPYYYEITYILKFKDCGIGLNLAISE